ncbi:MAG: DUF1257 domain-containing protein [Nitrosomonadales bacterium]|nr:DUF1257 domain-containing protein [Nitrosomonadales bacterium]
MSHFSQVQTVIRDQALLGEALRQLQFNFQSGEEMTINGYQGNTEQGVVVIKTGCRYDIGFQRQADGSFAVCADWWGIEFNTPIRQETFLQSLNRTYAHLAVKRQVLEQGLIIEQERILPNGEIELVVCERY